MTNSRQLFFFFQAEDGIRDDLVTGVQTCALPIYLAIPSTCDASLTPRIDYEIPVSDSRTIPGFPPAICDHQRKFPEDQIVRVPIDAAIPWVRVARLAKILLPCLILCHRIGRLFSGM